MKIRPGDMFKSGTDNVYLVVNDDIPRAMLVGCAHPGFCKISGAVLGMTWAIGNDPGDWWNVADGYTFDPVGKIKNPKDLKHGVPFSTVIDGKEVMAIVSYPEGRTSCCQWRASPSPG